jgi:hypothetical protein
MQLTESHVVLGRPSLTLLATDPAHSQLTRLNGERGRAVTPRAHPCPKLGNRLGAARRRQLRSAAVSRRKRSRRNRPDVGECPRPGLLIASALSSHWGGQGFKSPQLHTKMQVAALFRGYFRLPILVPFLSWERTGADLVQPTSLTSGDVPLVVRRVGAWRHKGGFGAWVRPPLGECGQPLAAPSAR